MWKRSGFERIYFTPGPSGLRVDQQFCGYGIRIVLALRISLEVALVLVTVRITQAAQTYPQLDVLCGGLS